MKIKKYQPTLSLKPTQFAVGLLEVEYKVVEFKNMKKKKLQKLIEETAVPVVISPWKELCVIDHHHYLFACWHANIHKVRVKVVKDYSKDKLSYHQFWRKLARLNYAYLYDQFGNGPQNALYLPMDVRGMAALPLSREKRVDTRIRIKLLRSLLGPIFLEPTNCSIRKADVVFIKRLQKPCDWRPRSKQRSCRDF
jgi:hypothetical protein